MVSLRPAVTREMLRKLEIFTHNSWKRRNEGNSIMYWSTRRLDIVFCFTNASCSSICQLLMFHGGSFRLHFSWSFSVRFFAKSFTKRCSADFFPCLASQKIFHAFFSRGLSQLVVDIFSVHESSNSNFMQHFAGDFRYVILVLTLPALFLQNFFSALLSLGFLRDFSAGANCPASLQTFPCAIHSWNPFVRCFAWGSLLAFSLGFLFPHFNKGSLEVSYYTGFFPRANSQRSFLKTHSGCLRALFSGVYSR